MKVKLKMHKRQANFIELKLASDDEDTKAGEFEGYGAFFGNRDSYDDVIAPGAFSDTIKEAKNSGQWPSMLVQHGGGFFGGTAADMMPVGIWTDMKEDENGLFVKGKLANTPRGKEVYELLKTDPRPAINGLSIGYRVKESERGTRPDEPSRTLKKIDLFEISLVTFPANPKARVNAVKSLRDFESALRDAGLSKSAAVKAVAVFKEMHQGDPGNQGLPGMADFEEHCDDVFAAEMLQGFEALKAKMQA